MKKIFLTILLIVTVVGINFSASAQDNLSPAKVIVYYFHGSFRCVTCTNMEKYSREAVETNFKDEVASGRVEFKAVNVEEKENEHFVDDYQLYTKTLILSLVKDGKEIESKNLDKIWQLVRNKQEFIDYVVSELNEFMKGVK